MFIPCGEIQLEALLKTASSEKAVVVSHPHPLYGGNMENPVVVTIADTFVEQGWSALRFNFRGTGRSTGSFDDGRGEVEDLLAVVSFMRENGFTVLTLAGYSFGSLMNALAVSSGLAVEDHIMISPPVDFMSFEAVKSLPDTGLVVAGDQDEFARTGPVRDLVETRCPGARLEIVGHADHFYSGKLDALYHILKDYLL